MNETGLSYREVPADDAHYPLNWALAYSGLLIGAQRRMQSILLGMRRGLYLDGRLVTQCIIHPLNIMSGGGTTILTGGICDVATPPEERRRGYVARLLREACAELRAMNAPLSALGPFKASFYGQFGWATFFEFRSLNGPPEAFASFRARQNGTWTRLENTAATIAELDAIYRAGLRGRFGLVERTTDWWQHYILPHEDPEKPRWTYVWRDQNGQGRAYIMYDFERRGRDRVLACREVIALDPEARAQIFGFFAAHENQVAEIQFSTPADAPVQTLFENPIQCGMSSGYMLRLVDVVAALEAFPYPKDGAGRIQLAINDDWISDNQGVFELEVEAGRARVKRLATGAEADIRCDVRVLAQIYSRYLRPRSAAAFGLLEAPSRAALGLLDQWFAGLAPYSLDWY